ncbi:MAG: response regulator [Verrucomicrobiales bacterium]
MTIRTLIVDDEPHARKRLRTLLAEESDIALLDDCANGEEALTAIEEHHPELLFLDIQMPKMGGFELLQELAPELLPTVVFTTAYDQHALRAFEVHAVDYLLKPFKVERFHHALQRVRDFLGKQQSQAVTEKLLAMLAEQQRQKPDKYRTRLTVKSDEKVILVKVTDVEFIESAGNYVVASTQAGNHILRETLTALDAQLDPEQFIRISRRAIVNVDGIKEFTPGFKGAYTVVLHSGKTLPMTRGLRDVENALSSI